MYGTTSPAVVTNGVRFKAVAVEADEYLKELSRYLHLNPVRLKRYKELQLSAEHEREGA
jgi:hypothetical protein